MAYETSIYVRCLEAYHKEKEGDGIACRGPRKRTAMNLCNGNLVLKISRQEQQRLGNAPLEGGKGSILQCFKLGWAAPEECSRESYPHLVRDTNGHSNLSGFDQIQFGSL